VPDRILIVERDAEDPTLWRYGLASEDGRLGDQVHRLRHDTATGSTPIGAVHAGLWPTVTLLIRQAGERTRIVYDLTLRPVATPEPPPRPPGAIHGRQVEGAWRDAQGEG
jgi:hypothetical protein